MAVKSQIISLLFLIRVDYYSLPAWWCHYFVIYSFVQIFAGFSIAMVAHFWVLGSDLAAVGLYIYDGRGNLNPLAYPTSLCCSTWSNQCVFKAIFLQVHDAIFRSSPGLYIVIFHSIWGLIV